jgi:hypothetical protein
MVETSKAAGVALTVDEANGTAVRDVNGFDIGPLTLEDHQDVTESKTSNSSRVSQWQVTTSQTLATRRKYPDLNSDCSAGRPAVGASGPGWGDRFLLIKDPLLLYWEDAGNSNFRLPLNFGVGAADAPAIPYNLIHVTAAQIRNSLAAKNFRPTVPPDPFYPTPMTPVFPPAPQDIDKLTAAELQNLLALDPFVTNPKADLSQDKRFVLLSCQTVYPGAPVDETLAQSASLTSANGVQSQLTTVEKQDNIPVAFKIAAYGAKAGAVGLKLAKVPGADVLPDVFSLFSYTNERTTTTNVTLYNNKLILDAQGQIQQFFVHDLNRKMHVRIYWDRVFGVFAIQEVDNDACPNQAFVQLAPFEWSRTLQVSHQVNQSLPAETVTSLKDLGISPQSGGVTFAAVPTEQYQVQEGVVKGLPPTLMLDVGTGTLTGFLQGPAGRRYEAHFSALSSAGEPVGQLWINIQVAAPGDDVTSLTGSVDQCNCQIVSGSAWDKSQPGRAISVDIYDGNNLLATVPANAQQQFLTIDPSALGIPDTIPQKIMNLGRSLHGFTYQLPATLSDGKSHLISVRFSGTSVVLDHSGKSITITAAPSITSQPVSVTTALGRSVTFSVNTTGAGLTYQWRKNGDAVPGATGASLKIPSTTLADVGAYSVVVSNGCGSSTSSDAQLKITPPPVIVTQPVGTGVCAGQSAALSVSATGTNLLYQWRKNTEPLVGAINATLQLPSAGAGNSGLYEVEVSDSFGQTVESDAAILTVSDLISIQSPPANAVALIGQPVKFSVTATGSDLHYQWRGKAGGNIPGATQSSYTIASVTSADAGSYYVVIFNGCSMMNSAAATLTVSSPPATGTNDSRFVSQSVLATLTMAAGQSYIVSIKMKNAGTATWTTANGYKLVSQGPVANTIWGTSRAELPTAIAPGGEVTFAFPVTAPSTPGTYHFEWRVAQIQTPTGFGDFSPANQITVTK